MTTQTLAIRSTRFKIGWIALLLISAVATLNHIFLIFAVMDEATLFVGWAAYTLYSAVVLFIPFRSGERWAWYTSWTLAVGFAFPILFTRESFATWYLIAAGLMALGLLLTRPGFFPRER